MDLDAVPDLLLWGLFSLVCLDIFRRISYRYWTDKLKHLFRSALWPTYPDVPSLVLQISGTSQYLSSADPLPIHFPDCLSTVPKYSSHLYKFTSLNSDKLNRLTSKYPQLSSVCLTVNNASSFEADYLIAFLTHYSGSIKYLILEVNFSTTIVGDILQNSIAIRNLIAAINSLPNLTHLSFEIANELPPEEPQISCPIFKQLQKFALYTHFNSLFSDSFRQYGSSIQSIHLSNEQLDNSLSLNTTNPKICSRIVDLSFKPFSPLDAKLDFICASFQNLHFLKITLENFYLVRLVNSLSQLKQMASLELEITSNPIEPITPSNRIPRERIPQLFSLKRLALCVSLTSHVDLHSNHLAWIFPNLESLLIDHNLTDCKTCQTMHYSISRCLFNVCHTEMIKPWKECPKLKNIQVVKG